MARDIGEHANVQIDLATAGTVRRLSADVQRNLFRIAQEAVANAIRHASARRIAIKPTLADIAVMFRAAADHTDYIRASAALSEIPSAMMTDEDRTAIVDAMIAATARLHKFPR